LVATEASTLASRLEHLETDAAEIRGSQAFQKPCRARHQMEPSARGGIPPRLGAGVLRVCRLGIPAVFEKNLRRVARGDVVPRWRSTKHATELEGLLGGLRNLIAKWLEGTGLTIATRVNLPDTLPVGFSAFRVERTIF